MRLLMLVQQAEGEPVEADSRECDGYVIDAVDRVWKYQRMVHVDTDNCHADCVRGAAPEGAS
ncbi:hypothetical protein ASF51_12100 [Agreia sp. Leaf283]|nr:hypothetical protein ASF51_12100 [Agreia sp. Leaf283]